MGVIASPAEWGGVTPVLASMFAFAAMEARFSRSLGSRNEVLGSASGGAEAEGAVEGVERGP